ncbi:MAG: hypothetical protein JWQ89_3327 [Devosia sp.]|uniref:hypothetical protein n=1 Tax=Devosia sp. TaxID=1871048 RepID=UPI0026395D2C|nr:hypothetical protein [Devosia sp.]MDB5541600.1 hypothetical protein [Devosia sp.]
MPREHVFEQASSDLAQWLDDTATQLADSLRGGGRAPFAANASESQKMHYYEQNLFNPDGSPNVQQRMAELHRLGITEYTKMLAEVTKTRQDRVSGTALLGAEGDNGAM